MLLTIEDATSVVHLKNVRRGLFVPDEEDVAVYKEAAREMLNVALSPEQSAELIAREAERIARWTQKDRLRRDTHRRAVR